MDCTPLLKTLKRFIRLMLMGFQEDGCGQAWD